MFYHPALLPFLPSTPPLLILEHGHGHIKKKVYFGFWHFIYLVFLLCSSQKVLLIIFEIHVSTHSFAVVSCYVLFLNWPHRRYSAIRASSVGYCASNMARVHFVCDSIVPLKLKTSMIDAQTPDILICPSSGGVPRFAWQLTTSAYAWAVSRRRHSSRRWTKHPARGLSLDYLILISLYWYS